MANLNNYFDATLGGLSVRTLVYSLTILATVCGLGSNASADPRLNAPRAASEPHWEGHVLLFGEAREIKDATPILERPYRPLHFYGNMQRRHFYRDTVIPSQQDRKDRRHAFLAN